MAKYKVGDKVRVREDLIEDKPYAMEGKSPFWVPVGGMLNFAGKIVTISEVCKNSYHIKEYSCEWTDEMFDDSLNWKVVITPKGNETLGRLYENGKVVKSVTTKKHPDDEYSTKVACGEVMKRLFETPCEEAKPYNGRFVVIDKSFAKYTNGKIYEVKDGRWKTDDGWVIPVEDMKPCYSFEEVDSLCLAKIIEVVE